MGYKFTLQDCIDLATFAHRHQSDKAGEPYITHPLRVLESVKAQGAQSYVQMAAILHDVTEDTPFTCQMLIDLGVPEAAVGIVQLLDRDYSKLTFYNGGYEYDPKYKGNPSDFYYYNIRRNPGALIVKKADIGDNTQPWRLEYLDKPTQERLRAKYAKALELLA